MASNFTVVQKGRENDTSFRLYFKNKDGVPISPFHDIPLYANEQKGVFNMIVEIPRWTNEKMEIATKEPLNPIKQDMKKGNLRYVKNVFPYHGYCCNYGALPQTWENPNHIEPSTGTKGDNDPIDVLEIGSRVKRRGEVIPVKLVGCVCLIDDGETDWKLIMIDVNDSDASKFNDIEDLEKHRPGLLKATIEWFTKYKIPDGNAPNKFAFNGQAKNRDFAMKILKETSQHWKDLISAPKNTSGLDLTNVTVSSSPYNVSNSEQILNSVPPASAAVPLTVEKRDDIDKWHYVSL